MKQFIYYFLFLVFVVQSFNVNAQNSAPVHKILKQAVEVLEEVETKTGLPKAGKVNITFQTEVSTETGVGVKILIFKFGRKWQRAQSNEITYNFALTPNKALHPEPIREALTKAIKESYDQLSTVSNDRAKIKGFNVKVSFVIEKSTTIEGEYELLPITPTLGRSWKKKAAHTIEIQFGGAD